jgi:hypothetical protein
MAMARRAGIRAATVAAAQTTTTPATNVSGSTGAISKSRLASVLLSPNAAVRPTIAPRPTRRPISIPTRPRTLPCVAPRAMRIPISRVRWVTAYEITANRPTIASVSAMVEKIPNSVSRNV